MRNLKKIIKYTLNKKNIFYAHSCLYCISARSFFYPQSNSSKLKLSIKFPIIKSIQYSIVLLLYNTKS